MPINHDAFSSKFKVPTQKEREKQAAFRKWQAVFYTVRYLMWTNVDKKAILREAIASGAIEPIAPGQCHEDDIKQLYKEAWQEFTEEFDAAFVKATLEEMVEFSKTRFNMGLEELLEENRRRSAQRYNR